MRIGTTLEICKLFKLSVVDFTVNEKNSVHIICIIINFNSICSSTSVYWTDNSKHFIKRSCWAIKSMAENTTRNKVFTARMWFGKNNHTNLTKTAYGLSEGWKELSAMNSWSKSPIVVIGSSPTALTYLIDILENAKDLPSLIIGMPVGFIGVEKSKNKLISTDLPRIVLSTDAYGH